MVHDKNNGCTLLAIALLELPGIDKRTCTRVMSKVTDCLATPTELLAAVRQWGGGQADSLNESVVEAAFDQARRRVEAATSGGITVITMSQSCYPALLRAIADPPPVIYVRGNDEAPRRKDAIAIVGTRTPTPFGEQTAYRMARQCAEAGVVVVSGLAPGCDTFAHEGCLDGGGITIAVLAYGIDVVYPPAKTGLLERIVQSGGTLVSEYPPGTTWRPKQFVERDRLQSGLSRAVLVIETDVKGGTMHTIRFAHQQGRAVACLVHPREHQDEPMAQGNQLLIRQRGATPIANDSDLAHLIEAVKRTGESASSKG